MYASFLIIDSLSNELYTCTKSAFLRQTRDAGMNEANTAPRVELASSVKAWREGRG